MFYLLLIFNLAGPEPYVVVCTMYEVPTPFGIKMGMRNAARGDFMSMAVLMDIQDELFICFVLGTRGPTLCSAYSFRGCRTWVFQVESVVILGRRITRLRSI
jgi:hypothetical protein